MEQRDGGVDEEGVAGDRGANRSVCGLEEGEASCHGSQLTPPSHADLEPYPHRPKHQRRREERARVAARGRAGAMGRHRVRRRGLVAHGEPHRSARFFFLGRSRWARTLSAIWAGQSVF